MSPLEPNMRATYETMMTPEQNLCYLSRILEKLGNLGKKTQDMFSIERGNIWHLEGYIFSNHHSHSHTLNAIAILIRLWVILQPTPTHTQLWLFVRTPHHKYFIDILASFGIWVVRVILFKGKSCWHIKCTKICNCILNSCCIFNGWATIMGHLDFLMPYHFYHMYTCQVLLDD